MVTAQKIEQAIHRVTDQSSFAQGLLGETLEWPTPEEIAEALPPRVGRFALSRDQHNRSFPRSPLAYGSHLPREPRRRSDCTPWFPYNNEAETAHRQRRGPP